MQASQNYRELALFWLFGDIKFAVHLNEILKYDLQSYLAVATFAKHFKDAKTFRVNLFTGGVYRQFIDRDTFG